MNYSIIPNNQLRELCIKKNWFTCGTTSQYNKLFEGNINGFTPMEIATIIWLCSDGTHNRDAILADLKSARAAWTRSLVTITKKSATVKAEYLTAIEEAETLSDLQSVRSRFNEDESLPYEDFVDCHNAFKLKRSELKGEMK